MAKPKLTTRQREKIADKLMMLGNIVFSAMVIAPLVSLQLKSASIVIAIVGGIVFGLMYLVAVRAMKGGGKP